MLKLISQFSFVLVFVSSTENILDTLNFISHPLRALDRTLNLNDSYFSSLENYHVNAVPVTETQYPWIARVVHSRTADIPHVCTAICIDEAIFITASRCIQSLKVNYTTVIYMSKRFEVLAFVVPSEPTKQLYDDIGFIVVDSRNFQGMWAVIELFDGTNRTDDAFKWFAVLDLSYGSINYKVVGYAMKKELLEETTLSLLDHCVSSITLSIFSVHKEASWTLEEPINYNGMHRVRAPERQYDLTELSVVVHIDLCAKILTQYGKLKGFQVPCYHSCTLQQFDKNNDKCYNYHGVEGGAVFDTISNKLMGIATWGAYFSKYELPVGFSVVNSANFFKDLICARRIRDDNGLLITKGYYQTLCNGP